MRKSPNPSGLLRSGNVMLFGVAAITLGYLLTAPAAAVAPQDVVDEVMEEPPTDPVAEQAQIETWSPEKQAAYEAWPTETKAYYWTLSPERQKMFWALADSDKVALTAMTGPEREEAWKQVEARAGKPPEAS